MTRKRYTPEQIIKKLREAEVMISDKKLTFTFLEDGKLKLNFNDEEVLTWNLIGDTLTSYENGKVDDIVYLNIINKNKFIMRYDKTDDKGIAFIRK
ncbi:hypothetical protein EB821_00910 [Candidatus Marinimicrobia bacterium PRS2]|nr:hypothetical protein EB821_00910 [Candidatus Marinimicrobia bacterium PRS2]